MKAYAAVRGFPKRLAGEDFYILNKLAKTGPILQLNQQEILIRDRPSARVPFGTGVAVSHISSMLINNEPYTLYNPDCFRLLKGWLSASEMFLRHKNIDELRQNLKAEVRFVAEEQQLLTGILRIKDKSKDFNALKRHFHTWFDGLKTLRFIHGMRDHFYKNLPITQVSVFNLTGT